MKGQRCVWAMAGVALLLAATASGATTFGDEPCSLRTIRGTYAWEMKGQAFGGGLSSDPLPVPGGIPMLQGTVFPVYMTGTMTIGSNGNAEGSYSGLFGLVPLGYSEPVPWAATFTVHPDCTGVMQAPNAFGGINTDVLVVLDNGHEIRTLGVDGAPLAWQFRMVRISRGHERAPMCGPHAARGRYLMQCDGFEVESAGPPPRYAGVSPLFLLDVDAQGTMAGLQFARDHKEGVPVAGTIEIEPDCTARTTMQTEALPGMTILGRSVYFDGGEEGFAGPILALSNGTPVRGAFAGFGCHLTRIGR
jgi:hypothetical protein